MSAVPAMTVTAELTATQYAKGLTVPSEGLAGIERRPGQEAQQPVDGC